MSNISIGPEIGHHESNKGNKHAAAHKEKVSAEKVSHSFHLGQTREVGLSCFKVNLFKPNMVIVIVVQQNNFFTFLMFWMDLTICFESIQ